MPEPMTPDQARTKVCPFMNRRHVNGEVTEDPETYVVTCFAEGCMCWGWVDGERGQLKLYGEDDEFTWRLLSEEDAPSPADGWQRDYSAGPDGRGPDGRVRYRRRSVRGPRRGQCEACSPNIEVSA